VRALAGVSVLVVALAVGVTGPRADGDPASDVLILQNVFLPSPSPTVQATNALNQAVASVYAKNDRVKVAVIGSPTDLGSVPSLFGKPGEYARFLGLELQAYYIGPLLIVMPAGFGIYDGGRTTAAASRVLAKMSVAGSSPDELTQTAADAVRKLAAARALVSKDIKAPYVVAYAVNTKPGATAVLQYSVFDDSGKTSEVIRVVGRRGRLATMTMPLRAVRPDQRYAVRWRVPKPRPRGDVTYCVVATDPAGNHAKGCAAIRF